MARGSPDVLVKKSSSKLVVSVVVLVVVVVVLVVVVVDVVVVVVVVVVELGLLSLVISQCLPLYDELRHKHLILSLITIHLASF